MCFGQLHLYSIARNTNCYLLLLLVSQRQWCQSNFFHNDLALGNGAHGQMTSVNFDTMEKQFSVAKHFLAIHPEQWVSFQASCGLRWWQKLVSYWVGVLSPVNRSGLHQAWAMRERSLFGEMDRERSIPLNCTNQIVLKHFTTFPKLILSHWNSGKHFTEQLKAGRRWGEKLFSYRFRHNRGSAIALRWDKGLKDGAWNQKYCKNANNALK